MLMFLVTNWNSYSSVTECRYVTCKIPRTGANNGYIYEMRDVAVLFTLYKNSLLHNDVVKTHYSYSTAHTNTHVQLMN